MRMYSPVLNSLMMNGPLPTFGTLSYCFGRSPTMDGSLQMCFGRM
ncbi:hypothetical protein HRbin12_01089 [bacterium HR12]|nr:hypothetical protein HRbin12_01089 [bacterium HR12]